MWVTATAESTQSTGAAQVRQQAAQGWHQSYEAFGRSIVVDIPIQVPDTDRFAVLSATFTPQLTTPVVSDWPDANIAQGEDFFRLNSHSLEDRRLAYKESAVETPPPGLTVIDSIYQGINQVELDTALAYNNPSTARDAMAIMQKVCADNFPDLQMESMPYSVLVSGEMRAYDRSTDTFYGDPWPHEGALIVEMHQVIDDIPVLCLGEQCLAHFDKAPFQEQGMWLIGGTTILQKFPDDDTMLSIVITHHTYQKTDTILADLPLCRLEQVIQTYEQLIEQGLLREVHSLQLGYVSWQTGENTFTLIPTWALIGYLYPDAETETKIIRQSESPRTMEYGIILVNAQTGELIDPANVDVEGLYQCTP